MFCGVSYNVIQRSCRVRPRRMVMFAFAGVTALSLGKTRFVAVGKLGMANCREYIICGLLKAAARARGAHADGKSRASPAGTCVKLLHHDDVVVLKQLFVFLGEFVVSYEHVDVLDVGKGVGIYFAYLGAVQHHVHVARLFEYLF